MIKPVTFMGKAYFLDGALSDMPKEHKQRIENYAKKTDEKTSVVVIGKKKETIYEFDGVDYKSDEVSFNVTESKYQIKTDKGLRTVSPDRLIISEIPIPVYNAYIIYDFNTENVKLPHYTKEFDFRPGAKSTILGCNYKEYNDIPY